MYFESWRKIKATLAFQVVIFSYGESQSKPIYLRLASPDLRWYWQPLDPPRLDRQISPWDLVGHDFTEQLLQTTILPSLKPTNITPQKHDNFARLSHLIRFLIVWVVVLLVTTKWPVVWKKSFDCLYFLLKVSILVLDTRLRRNHQRFVDVLQTYPDPAPKMEEVPLKRVHLKKQEPFSFHHFFTGVC